MIAPAIMKHFPMLNQAQLAIVGHAEGPLLVIAGPGSGKTYCIVLRALNLFLLEKASPREMRNSHNKTRAPARKGHR